MLWKTRFVALISKSAMPHHLAITLADLLSQCTCQFHGDADVQKEVRDEPRRFAAAGRPAGKRAKRGGRCFFFSFWIFLGQKPYHSPTEKPERTPKEIQILEAQPKLAFKPPKKLPPKTKQFM